VAAPDCVTAQPAAARAGLGARNTAWRPPAKTATVTICAGHRLPASLRDHLCPCALRYFRAVQAARCELAAEFIEDLRHVDAQMRETRKKLTAAVRASGTSLTGLSGVGPIIAATIIGGAGEVSRFPDRDHFAAYNRTAPIEVSSGNRTIYRLSRRGNRRLNHAIHMAAVTQVRQRHSAGRAYFEKKLAGGKTRKEALRALKRRISDAVFARRQAGSRRAARANGPGGQSGNDSIASAAGSHPEHRLFGQATPGPARTLRPRPAPQRRTKTTPARKPHRTS
jgi:transposase